MLELPTCRFLHLYLSHV